MSYILVECATVKDGNVIIMIVESCTQAACWILRVLQ